MPAQANLDISSLFEEIVKQRGVGVHFAVIDDGIGANVLPGARRAVGQCSQRKNWNVRNHRNWHGFWRGRQRLLQPFVLRIIKVGRVAIVLRLHAVEANESPWTMIKRVVIASDAKEVTRETLAPVCLRTRGFALLAIPTKDVVISSDVVHGNPALPLQCALKYGTQLLRPGALRFEHIHHCVAASDDEVGLHGLRVIEGAGHAFLCTELRLHMNVGEMREADGAGHPAAWRNCRPGTWCSGCGLDNRQRMSSKRGTHRGERAGTDDGIPKEVPATGCDRWGGTGHGCVRGL